MPSLLHPFTSPPPQGRTVSFKNAIIIMTSNLGSSAIIELDTKEEARDMVMATVRSHFRPEFVNRIDEFIIFDPLEQDQIRAIVRMQVRGEGGRVGFSGVVRGTMERTRAQGCL